MVHLPFKVDAQYEEDVSWGLSNCSAFALIKWSNLYFISKLSYFIEPSRWCRQKAYRVHGSIDPPTKKSQRYMEFHRQNFKGLVYDRTDVIDFSSY